MPRESIHVGLDIGTTKVCAVVGLVTNGKPVESVEILGVGTSPSQGIRRGAVVSIDHAVESVRRAVDEAEVAAGVKISAVLVGIAGVHAKGFTSVGRVTTREAEVTRGDVERVMQAAKEVDLPAGQEILHTLPKGFIVDEQEGVREPVGMYAERLRTEVFLVTVGGSAKKNLMKCVRQSELDPVQVILQSLAASEAIVTPEERELGVAMIDLGGGTTDLAVFVEGSIWHTGVLPLGGAHLTSDVAHGLRILASEAERIKVRYGCAVEGLVTEDQAIELAGQNGQTGQAGRTASRRALAKILQLRAEEIFTLVVRELKRTGVERQMASGVILTGGSATMEGMPELAERILQLPVRRGTAQAARGSAAVTANPQYATGVGLILYALRHPEEGMARRRQGIMRRTAGRIQGWLGELF